MLNAVLLLLGVASANADSVMKRGAMVPSGPAVSVSQVLADPSKYADAESVVIEGLVIKSCTNMGCWMQVADGPDAKGIQVDFHNGGFVIPMGASGMVARAMGKVSVKVLSAEDATEAEGEGARIEKNAKGEMTEISLVASGVELYYVD